MTLRNSQIVRMGVAALLGAAVVLGAAGLSSQPEPSGASDAIKECKITLTNGSSISGLLMQSSDDQVVIRVNGIDTTIERTRIASLRFLPPVEERYRDLRRGIADTDIDARLTLVEWLRKRRAYALALSEVESILEIAPGDLRAKNTKRWIEQQRDLQRKRETPESEKPETRPRADPPEDAGIRTLTPEEINLIRVYEVDLDDPPKMLVEDGTLDTLMRRSPGAFPVDPQEREAMLSLPPHEQLRVLFSNQARDLYGKVRVMEDPESLALFRDSIAGGTGWLTNACATTRCHGGAEAGRFRLVRQNPNSDESVYTNFMILNTFRLDDGRPLIDTSEPARSPLIHLAMLRSNAQTPHPRVDPRDHGRDWRPVIRSPRDASHDRVIEWIRSLYTPRPAYGIPDPLEGVEPSP